MGPGDHKCHEGQKLIVCEKLRDKYDRVIVQEKLDGSNVSVALIDDSVVALSRAGYLADTSPYIQHHFFAAWVKQREERFRSALFPGERICGEWLLVAHGTKYDLPHEPFVVFDIMRKKHERLHFDDFIVRVSAGNFITPKVLSDGPPVDITTALSILGTYGHHGALEPVEGVVWRVERSILKNKHIGNSGGRSHVVDFLVKFVYPEKIDGKYLNEKTIYNSHN